MLGFFYMLLQRSRRRSARREPRGRRLNEHYKKRRTRLSPLSRARRSLRRVLRLARGERLPLHVPWGILHVPWGIGPAALERDYVIHDIARPAVRIAGLRHELLPGLRAAGDPPVAVPRAD